jgi:hypothetical protein
MSMYLPNPDVGTIGAEPGEFLELPPMADQPLPAAPDAGNEQPNEDGGPILGADR